MMRFPQTLRSRMAAFRDSEKGSASVELVLVVPVLAFITFGLVTYFDAFKAKTHATRATTVMSDMVSRETNPITPTYLTGMSGLMDSIINGDETPEYRLTAFLWNETRGEYRVRWSKNDSSYGSLTSADLNLVADKLPVLEHGQRALLLETWVDHTPLVDVVGLTGEIEFENFVVAAPRFVPQLCWLNGDDADPTTAQC